MFAGMLFSCYICRTFLICGSSSVGRALASQAGGRGFESRLPLFNFKAAVRSKVHPKSLT